MLKKVFQAGGGGAGALCVPRAKFRRGEPEKGQEDRESGAVTGITKSESVYLAWTQEVPGLHLHVKRGEVDKPGVKEKRKKAEVRRC